MLGFRWHISICYLVQLENCKDAWTFILQQQLDVNHKPYASFRCFIGLMVPNEDPVSTAGPTIPVSVHRAKKPIVRNYSRSNSSIWEQSHAKKFPSKHPFLFSKTLPLVFKWLHSSNSVICLVDGEHIVFLPEQDPNDELWHRSSPSNEEISRGFSKIYSTTSLQTSLAS